MIPMPKMLVLLVALSALVGGCAQRAGVIFPPLADAPHWPPPPDRPRIRYVGQLATDADLKPGRSALEGLGQALFGKKPVHSMLSPFALCTDGGDRLFVADSNGQVVHVFNLNTRRYAQWRPPPQANGAPTIQPAASGFSQPVGIAYDARSHRLLVADSVAGVIFCFDAASEDGKFLGAIGQGRLDRPCGIAVHPATGRIYIADVGAHQVVVLSGDGQQEVVRIGRRGVAPGQFNFPTAVAFDHQGRLYVSDSLNFRVQQIAPDMTTIRIIGSKGDLPGYFAQPRSLAVDSADHLYVVDNQFETVQMFNAEGQLLMDFGEEGRGLGQFWLPGGIFIDPRNRIWIADSYNRRVQVFDYLPEEQQP